MLLRNTSCIDTIFSYKNHLIMNVLLKGFLQLCISHFEYLLLSIMLNSLKKNDKEIYLTETVNQVIII